MTYVLYLLKIIALLVWVLEHAYLVIFTIGGRGSMAKFFVIVRVHSIVGPL